MRIRRTIGTVHHTYDLTTGVTHVNGFMPFGRTEGEIICTAEVNGEWVPITDAEFDDLSTGLSWSQVMSRR